MEGAKGSEADDSGGREPVSAASRLTDDLVLQILSRLPARSLHRFRCISRHWRDLICDPEHRARMTQTLAGFMYIGWSRYDDNNGRSLRFTSARATPGGGIGGEAAAAPPLIDPLALSLPPGFHQRLFRIQCCNGLLLLCAWAPSSRGAFKFNYTVCSPATDEWTTVPDSPVSDTAAAGCTTARLAFDPSSPSSSAYRIFQFQNDGPRTRVSPKVWIYSSETGAWTCRECGWADGAGVVLRDETSGVFFRGKLHLCPSEPVIVSVDRDGEKWWTTPKPADPRDDGFLGAPPGFIGVSQGRLLFLNNPEYNQTKMRVWERGSGVWVPKRSIDLEKVVGGWDFRFGFKCSVVGIHPDRSMVYFLEGKDNRLVSYAMDDGDGETICELGYKNCYLPFLPYVPVFARSLTGRAAA